MSTYHSLDALDMADAIRAKDGMQPPGKIYSFRNSGLVLILSYNSSGIAMDYAYKLNVQIKNIQVRTNIIANHTMGYKINIYC